MIPVCAVDDLPAGEAVRVEADVPIAIFNADGTYYAIDDTCTHQDASLADGWLEDCQVECPLHASCFDLRTGRPTGPPAKKPVRTHEVVVRDGYVYVLPAAPAALDGGSGGLDSGAVAGSVGGSVGAAGGLGGGAVAEFDGGSVGAAGALEGGAVAVLDGGSVGSIGELGGGAAVVPDGSVALDGRSVGSAVGDGTGSAGSGAVLDGGSAGAFDDGSAAVVGGCSADVA